MIAGASDADPTTVATIAVIGAGTIYELGWLTLLLFPLIAVVQSIATRVGVAGRVDLQTAVARTRGPAARWSLLISIVAVNIVTIAADLEGGAAAAGLIFRQDWRWFVVPLSVVLLAGLLFVGYHVMQRALKYLLLCLLAYAVAAVLARPDWAAVAAGSLVPHIEWDSGYLSDVMSLVGTTLTGYVYFWQTVGQAEDQVPWRLHRARQADSLLGSLFAVAVFWFILIASGATLGVHHLPAGTAQGAAQALRPVAGPFAGDLFAVGLLASALIALPVIMATTAYATGAHLDWRRGLSLKVTRGAAVLRRPRPVAAAGRRSRLQRGVPDPAAVHRRDRRRRRHPPRPGHAPDGRRRQAPDERPHPPPWPEDRRLDHHYRDHPDQRRLLLPAAHRLIAASHGPQAALRVPAIRRLTRLCPHPHRR